MSNRAKAGDGLVGSEPLHIIPINDLREHEESPNCWCKPKVIDDVGVGVDDNPPLVDIWVHNSMDRREEYEEGRRLQ